MKNIFSWIFFVFFFLKMRVQTHVQTLTSLCSLLYTTLPTVVYKDFF